VTSSVEPDVALGEVAHAEEGIARTRRATKVLQTQLWPIATSVALAAFIATAVNAPGWYVADNRFEFYWTPGQLLGRIWSIWEPARGLGRFRYDFWPTTVGVWVLRGVGLSPAWAEQVWHAAELAAAGIGIVVVLRLFRPRICSEHVVAAALYMFSPYTAVFLVPSAIFLGYSLAPWLLYAFVRGVRESRRWRWAAVFALLVFLAGNVNYPGFPGVALAALATIPAAIYLVHVEQSARWRTVGGWLLRAAVLCLLVSAAALVTTHYGSSLLSDNLAESEQPKDIANTSSWAESWRGLGLWQTYWIDFGRHFDEYFTSAPGVLVTFLAPCAALAALWLTRFRERLLFAAIALIGIVAMVGAFPPDGPSAYGRLLLSGFDAIPQLAGIRTTYKAGAGAAIGIAALVGIGVGAAAVAIRARRRYLSWIPVVVALVAIGAAASPFWSGNLYSSENRMHSIPGYWSRAFKWLNSQPGDGRVLVLPSVVDGMYTWGEAGDDIVDAYLSRPHIAREQLMLYNGTAQAGNVVVALDDFLEKVPYRPGVLAPIARRLGIKYLLIRNDLDWPRINRPSPAQFTGLRRDPDVAKVKQFGRPGQNISRRRGVPASTHRLAPVEIYEVKDSGQQVRAETSPPVLVSGDGEAWPQLAETGVLDRAGPVRYTAAMSGHEIAASLASGSQLIVTDTNRRRVGRAPIDEQMGGYSYTLPTNGSLNREPQDLFKRSGSQSVAFYPDAASITGSASGLLLGGEEQPVRPSNAFDGDPATAWKTGALQHEVAGRSVRATFRRGVPVSQLNLVPTSTTGSQRRIEKVVVKFSDGSVVRARLHGQQRTVAFRERRTRSIEVRIASTSGRGFGPVGFSEIVVPGLDLREFIQAPNDVFRVARRTPGLQSRIGSSPIEYQFFRQPPIVYSSVEVLLRRRFESVSQRDYQIAGVTGFSPETPPAIVNSLDAGRLPLECHDGLLTVDGNSVPIRIDATPESAVASAPVSFVSCGPVHLDSGWHTLETSRGSNIDQVLVTAGVPRGPGESATVTAVSRGDDHVGATVTSNISRTAVIVGQSYDDTWRGRVDGAHAGVPLALDTQTGWFVGPGTHRVQARVGAQTVYRASLIITGVGLLTCLALVFTPARWSFRRWGPNKVAFHRRAAATRARMLVGAGGIVAMAWFFAGLLGLAAAVAALLVATRRGPRWVAGGAFASLVVAAVASVLQGDLDESYTILFPRDRPIATSAALVAAVLAFVAVVAFAYRERHRRAHDLSEDRSWSTEMTAHPCQRR
jgi:hypothetical protein